MSLQERVMTEMKAAMRAKDTVKLEALRAIKSELLLVQTSSATKEGLTDEEEMKILQKLVKQRRDSAAIYKEQGREDLAQPEVDQAAVISMFLPEQMTDEEIEAKVDDIISRTGAEGMKDMGKVMGLASSELTGKADGKTISIIVKRKLG
ncbi:GatB/YqeY domain-containing protein [soil metagenome]